MSEPPPRPPGQYPPPPGQYPPAYGMPPVPPPTSGKATTSLVLGIVSIVMCGLFLGVPAMILSRQAKREIAASQGRLGGDGLATAGFITGLVGTIWSVLGAVLVVVLIAVGSLVGHQIEQNCHTVVNQDGSSTLTCDNT